MNEQLDKLVRKEFGLGSKDSQPMRIEHCRDPRMPQFEFEWHPNTQKVYRIDVPGEWIDHEWVADMKAAKASGFCIAEHCLTHAQFLGFVQTFLRGYALACVHWAKGTIGDYIPDKIKESDPCPVR